MTDGRGWTGCRWAAGSVLGVAAVLALAGCGAEPAGDVEGPDITPAGAPSVSVASGAAALTAGDEADLDAFGWSVALSGNTAVVGAPGHEVGGVKQGAAYVFVQDGENWTQQAELTASDGAAGDRFGYAVSVSGGTVLVGAWQTGSPGKAYVFVQKGTQWTQEAELTPADGAAGDEIGDAVSVSDGTALVGAPGHGGQGAAYVFTQSGDQWTQEAELTAGDGAESDGFGSAVSVSGGQALVGASLHEVDSAMGAGAAYLFTQQGTQWTQQVELTAADGAAGDGFGGAVALDGSTAIVGASGHAVGGASSAGAAYVFAQSGKQWTKQAELTAADAAEGNGLGRAVSLSGGNAFITAPGSQAGGAGIRGAVYMFVQSGTSWTETAELAPSVSGDYGASVAAGAGTAIVGAPATGIGNDASAGVADLLAFCVIDGTAYPAGMANPNDECQVCTPWSTATSWSVMSTITYCTMPPSSSGSCSAATAPGAGQALGPSAIGALLGLAALRRRKRGRGASA